jgi:hypothetical protein
MDPHGESNDGAKGSPVVAPVVRTLARLLRGINVRASPMKAGANKVAGRGPNNEQGGAAAKMNFNID